ncbi:DUF3179 domain-containing protein [Litoribrevibacter euphylliae]
MMEMNGFKIESPLIPADEIMHGGPPRDGIPAIDDPEFITRSESNLNATDKVLGVTLNNQAKAYPINILNYHELVNDELDGHPITVSFCPLCGTGIVFNASSPQKRMTFGVSGLLYNSDLLMYDRETESLWSQIEGRAISGPLKGTILERLPVEHTFWQDWQQRHPNTLVLSEDTGYWRNYQNTPYPNYDKTKRTYFPVNHTDRRYHPKSLVIGIEMNGHYKAYPFAELQKATNPLHDNFQGKALRVHYNPETQSARIEDSKGQTIVTLTAFWFAWIAFHPDSEVYQNLSKNKSSKSESPNNKPSEE